MTSPNLDITTLSPLPPNIQARILQLLTDAPTVNLLCTCRAMYEQCVYALYREVTLHHGNFAGYLAFPLPNHIIGQIHDGPDSKRRIPTDEQEDDLCRRAIGRAPRMAMLDMQPQMRMTALRGSTSSITLLDYSALLGLVGAAASLREVFCYVYSPHPTGYTEDRETIPPFWGLRALRLGPVLLGRVNRCPSLWREAVRTLVDETLRSISQLSVCFEFPRGVRLDQEAVAMMVRYIPRQRGWRLHLHNIAPTGLEKCILPPDIGVHVYLPHEEDERLDELRVITRFLERFAASHDSSWNP
ncbi:hypothetical protein IAT38_005951 [Cryptococcus sp. DSM 104549]